MRITRYAYPITPCARVTAGNFENQIEQLLGNVFGREGGFNLGGFFPVDLYEDKENTYVRAELPGVARGDINVEVADGSLEISATRRDGVGENASAVALKRSVLVPENTQADKISAACENGVLTVTLPKQEQAKPRKFTVQIN